MFKSEQPRPGAHANVGVAALRRRSHHERPAEPPRHPLARGGGMPAHKPSRRRRAQARVVREARATPPDVGGRDPERNWKSGTKQSSSSCRPGSRVKARPVKPGPGDGRTAFAIHVSLARRKSRIRLTRSSSRSRGFLPWKALIKFQNWSRTAIWENADVLGELDTARRRLCRSAAADASCWPALLRRLGLLPAQMIAPFAFGFGCRYSMLQ